MGNHKKNAEHKYILLFYIQTIIGGKKQSKKLAALWHHRIQHRRSILPLDLLLSESYCVYPIVCIFTCTMEYSCLYLSISILSFYRFFVFGRRSFELHVFVSVAGRSPRRHIMIWRIYASVCVYVCAYVCFYSVDI